MAHVTLTARSHAARALAAFRHHFPYGEWRHTLSGSTVALTVRWRGRTASAVMTAEEAEAADPAYDWVRRRMVPVLEELLAPGP